MRRFFAWVARFAVTAVVVLVAGIVAWQLWDYAMNQPWTRDGRVRADVVGIAPDVSGLVSDVPVADNQMVKRGDVLMRIDPQRFQLAVRTAEATVAGSLATLQQAQRDLRRYETLTADVASEQRIEQAQATTAQAQAAYDQALANRDIARLNLARCEVKAPVDGVISNLELRPGDYVAAGKGVMALVDSDSLHVEGYFEETKLPRIRIGDPVTVRLMGESAILHGRVESLAGGIEDRDRSAGGSLLASINPSFSWVRLAQRVPVRVQLDTVPGDVRLLAGRTATVWIEGPDGATGPGFQQTILRWLGRVST